MKFELKRNIKTNIIVSGVFAVLGILCFLLDSKDIDRVCGIALSLLGIGSVIHEIIKSKSPVLTFDEKGFCIGESRYNYRDIEEIESSRHRSTTHVTIIIGGQAVYEFDNYYKNSNEFVKQLTLHGVDHNLFS